MRDYAQKIEQTKKQIAELHALLAELEQEQHAYLEQLEQRKTYLSSREILDLLNQKQGRYGSMASIKRWSDNGYLGDGVDEREAFPLLASKQGNKRFLYPREAVLAFLDEKGLLAPAYDVLDRVQLRQANRDFCWALVTAVSRHDLRFFYQVQLEATGEVVPAVPEEELFLPLP
ncbi:hypothetical protein EN829_053965 [Mesorhizobium sp. M00.F.Ca.ET.186.01.1.1]|uniref:hypothetical protein n=1 Tax=Brevibacillus parabrevis TaxID=54914 RepID=UPI0011342E31|nr:hypothetical protein [Brevibacillus parabrevis]TGV05939.1 hypothetical protein EN829_053965 [Mesorhizobium sp. M00.F.Ca.ET.186.01.1.1]